MRRPLARSLVLGRPGLFYGSAVRDYLDRVRAADGAGLERGVTNGINTYISGLITANMLNTSEGVISQAASKIKAHCILAGANTLSGCLVPVVGPTPTNVNFVPADYNRKLGLGDPANATKRLGTGYAFTSDMQDDCCLAAFFSSNGSTGFAIGYGDTNGSGSFFSPSNSRLYAIAPVSFAPSDLVSTGFRGVSRGDSVSYLYRRAGSNQTATIASGVVAHEAFSVFARTRQGGTFDNFSNARLTSFLISRNIDLAILQSLQDQLVAAFNAAIP